MIKYFLAVLFILLYGCKIKTSEDEKHDSSLESDKEVIFRHPSPYVLSFIANEPFILNSINYKSFRVYFKNDSYTAGKIPNIKRELDDAYARIFSVLDISEYPYGIYLLAVDSKQEMKEVMGYKIKGGAAQGQDLVFFVYNDTIRPQFKHEIFHLISYEMWGPTKYRLLDEGGATYTDNFCYYDNPMYTLNKYFMNENLLYDIKDLINNFDIRAAENDVVTYIQSAGYFKYLYENYGVTKMRQLWNQGFEFFEDIYGFDIEEFDRKWRNMIKNTTLPEGFDATEIMAHGCG